METTTSTNTTFTCNRKAFQAALGKFRLPKTAQLYIVTNFAENQLILKTSLFDMPVECIDHWGNDTTIIVPYSNMKEYCKYITDGTLKFTVNGDTLQINTTILSLKRN